MSIDTKLVIMTSNKDVFAILNKVEKALDEVIRPIHKGVRIRPSIRFQIHTYGMVTASFDTKESSLRQLNIHFDCDTDCENETDNLFGKKLIFSIGAWGKNSEIMHTLAYHLQDLGKIYIKYDDCSDPFIELTLMDINDFKQLKEQSQDLNSIN